jgi:hypothetical protein
MEMNLLNQIISMKDLFYSLFMFLSYDDFISISMLNRSLSKKNQKDVGYRNVSKVIE